MSNTDYNILFDLPKSDFIKIERFIHSLEMTLRGVLALENKKAEIILRNYVDPPIKGEITKSKCKWRGIKSVIRNRDWRFVGILQRDTLITADGRKIPFVNGKLLDTSVL